MRIAVLISGSGRSLKNLIDLQDELGVKVAFVLASKHDVPGLQYAKQFRIPFACNTEVYPHVNQMGIDLIVMAGWLKKIDIIDEWKNRVMNIHPSLLPAFGGRGMYGHHVHEAVIESGTKYSGCTVHYADNEYDHGPIILQRLVPVLDDDTAQTLADRVFEQEKLAYPDAIRLHAEGRLVVKNRRVCVKS